MYTHTPRTSAEIKADIAAVKFALTLEYDDDLHLQDELQSLLEELDEALAAEPSSRVAHPRRDQGLNMPLVAKAFGGIPKDWDEGFLP